MLIEDARNDGEFEHDDSERRLPLRTRHWQLRPRTHHPLGHCRWRESFFSLENFVISPRYFVKFYFSYLRFLNSKSKFVVNILLRVISLDLVCRIWDFELEIYLFGSKFR